MFGNKITKIKAREILDSRGNPTLETTVWSGGVLATASVPSGASTGSHEARELRDGDKRRYGGLGVRKAVAHVNIDITKVVIGLDPGKQEKIDQLMTRLDGTDNKSLLGANAILSVSSAVAKLAAALSGQELYRYLAKRFGFKNPSMPVALFNVINGGAHADSGLDIQEYFIIPKRGRFSERLEKAVLVYQALKREEQKLNMDTGIGDEGGFSAHFASNELPFELLSRVIAQCGLKLKRDIAFGIDAAASEFYNKKNQQYQLSLDKQTHDRDGMLGVYSLWTTKYNLEVVEDPFAEDDTEGWQLMTKKYQHKLAVVGDDLFVTNAKRLAMGIAESAANAIVIKPNQIGTLSQTIATIRLAQKHGYKIIVSHRSGETCDTFIADLAVAVGADYIKAGAPARGERVAKYNRLLEIEQQL